MTEYSYTKAGVDESKLQAEIVAVGLPVDHIAGGAANLIVIYMTRDLLPGEKTILDNTVASHDGRPRGKRPIISIYTDLGSLSINQRTAIWSNLTAGTPPLWTLDLGPNAATLYSFRFQATTGSLTVAERNDAQRWAVAMYCQDNPKYLVAPTFDPTINVAGDQVGGVRGLLPEDQAVINQLFKALRPTPLQSTVVSDRTLTAATSLVLWNQWQITNFEPFVLRGPGRYQMEGSISGKLFMEPAGRYMPYDSVLFIKVGLSLDNFIMPGTEVVVKDLATISRWSYGTVSPQWEFELTDDLEHRISLLAQVVSMPTASPIGRDWVGLSNDENGRSWLRLYEVPVRDSTNWWPAL
jgi:hypothetical protein